jgi:outer membrane receptor for ferrienterochelin and colicin
MQLRKYFFTSWLAGLVAFGLPGLIRAQQPQPKDNLDDEQHVSGTNETDDSDDELMNEFAFLEEADVVESAARHRQEIGMSPSAITVITRQDIEASGAVSLIDLFRIVPGLGVVKSTLAFPATVGRLPWGAENIFFLVLIDGRETNLELIGSPPWETQPISLEDIERIEILRGPGSSLYGANAVAGVISITTRAIQDKTSGSVLLAGGEDGYVEAYARASTRFGNWGISASGGGDTLGSSADFRSLSKQAWKFRSVVEHRWSDTRRLILDAGMSGASGFVDTGMGMLDVSMMLRTLRLAYISEDIRAHVYWCQAPTHIENTTDLEYAGIVLASFIPIDTDSHTVDGEIQYSLPRFYEPLLIIVGGGGRFTWLGSDQLLDGVNYADPNSSGFHKTGISHQEMRAGSFVHGEYTPADWVTITAGLRFDYNTETGIFLSPRLATVFKPMQNQFLRVNVARAFRKPPFIDSRLHAVVSFPEDSPITGTGQQEFQEFMTRVSGNHNLDNEELWAFEVGYLGQFLDKRLSISVDLFWNIYYNEISVDYNIIPDPMGLPDLHLSSALSRNSNKSIDIIGSELSVSYEISKDVSLMAYWVHRQVFDRQTGKTDASNPKNLFAIGGRYKSPGGLLGSLFAFVRSELNDNSVPNPDGIFAPILNQKLDNVVLLLGRLGWAWRMDNDFAFEAGLKLFFPISFGSNTSTCFFENGGGVTPEGAAFGGTKLCRLASIYLEGSF